MAEIIHPSTSRIEAQWRPPCAIVSTSPKRCCASAHLSNIDGIGQDWKGHKRWPAARATAISDSRGSGRTRWRRRRRSHFDLSPLETPRASAKAAGSAGGLAMSLVMLRLRTHRRRFDQVSNLDGMRYIGDVAAWDRDNVAPRSLRKRKLLIRVDDAVVACDERPAGLGSPGRNGDRRCE